MISSPISQISYSLYFPIFHAFHIVELQVLGLGLGVDFVFSLSQEGQEEQEQEQEPTPKFIRRGLTTGCFVMIVFKF